MLHVIFHTFIDTIKIIPFLYVAFLIIELIEHKLKKENEHLLVNGKKYGPILGGILGMLPQCGFSALATNLFASRVITIGTLIAVYLSTSDEMLAVMLSGGMPIVKVVSIIFLKAIIGIIFGLLIDFVFHYHKKNINKKDITKMCQEEGCHCEKNFFIGSLSHTINVALYIFIASFIIGLLIHYIGHDKIGNILLQGNILSYFLSSLIGLIPNCASSVMISELYIKDIISLGNLFSGLLTASGVGILILFKVNKHLKENLFIIALIYFIGIICGIIIDKLGILL